MAAKLRCTLLAKLKCPLFPDLAHRALNREAVMDRAGTITMTMRALDRIKIIQALVDGNLSLKLASERLGFAGAGT